MTLEDSPRHVLVVGGLVRNGAGQVLMVRHHRRGWELPQGRVEQGEDLLQALHREVAEEAGVTIAAGPLAGVWSKLSAPAAVVFMFLGTYRGGDLAASEETPEVGWFPTDEALRLVTHPVNRDRLETLLAHDGAVAYRTFTTGPYRVVAAGVL